MKRLFFSATRRFPATNAQRQRLSSGKLQRDKTLWSDRLRNATFQPTLLLKKKIDWGTVIMNVGAISGLCGFMMSDVLHLRVLSICGSLCGVGYNISRTPRQLNACLWGGVFISTNVFMILQLLKERNSDGPQFNLQEMELWTRHFKEYGVNAKAFKNMVKNGQWQTYNKGEEIVTSGKALDQVLIVHEGTACAFRNNGSEEMYKYEGRGRNGCIIGGTALVDPQTVQHPYPHSVLADVDGTVVVSWDREELKMLMQHSPTVENAFVHTMYVDLIHGLRRERKRVQQAVAEGSSGGGGSSENGKSGEGGGGGSSSETTATIDSAAVGVEQRLKVREMLSVYRDLLEAAIDTSGTLDPRKKRIARKYALRKGISLAHHVRLINTLGWHRHEWQDGIKEDDEKEITPRVRKLRHALTIRKVHSIPTSNNF